jgi:hypothetical protein
MVSFQSFSTTPLIRVEKICHRPPNFSSEIYLSIDPKKIKTLTIVFEVAAPSKKATDATFFCCACSDLLRCVIQIFVLHVFLKIKREFAEEPAAS